MSAERRGFVIWLTGLPCAGKSTLSEAVERRLREAGHATEILDGDVVRKNLSSGLGFSRQDREENIRRVAFVAALLARHGIAVLVSLVSPYRQMRDSARAQTENFAEVYVRCPLTICEKRDVKGMYKLARIGKILAFTGVSDPYEEPLRPEVTVDTDRQGVDACVAHITEHLKKQGWLG